MQSIARKETPSSNITCPLLEEEVKNKENAMGIVIFLVLPQIKKHTETPWDEDSLHWEYTAREVLMLVVVDHNQGSRGESISKAYPD